MCLSSIKEDDIWNTKNIIITFLYFIYFDQFLPIFILSYLFLFFLHSGKNISLHVVLCMIV